jgi:hypothetical protein
MDESGMERNELIYYISTQLIEVDTLRRPSNMSTSINRGLIEADLSHMRPFPLSS